MTIVRASDTDRRLTFAVVAAGFVTFAGLYAPQGVLTTIAADLGIAAGDAALLMSAATAGLAAAVLPWAWIARRVGVGRALRIAAVAAAVATLATALTPSFELLLIARSVQGAALGGIPAAAMALLHERSTPLRAAVLSGRYVAATSIGGMAGRLVTAPLALALDWRAALLVADITAAVTLLLLAVVLPSDGGSRGSERGRAAAVLRDPVLLALWAIGGLLLGAMVAVYNTLPFRLEAPPFALSATIAAGVFVVYLAGTVSSRSSAYLSARIGAWRALSVAFICIGLGALLMVVDELWAILVGLAAVTAGMFLGHAIAVHLVGARTRRLRSFATGGYTVVYYVGATLLGLLAAQLWDAFGWAAVTVLVITAAVLGLALVWFAVSDSRREHAVS